MSWISRETQRLVLLGQAGWPEEVIRSHVREMCNSAAFDDGEQARNLLSYLVKEALHGHVLEAGDIARALGKRDFGKGDPFVRSAMQRLRKRMQDYYAATPRKRGLRLELPSETYLVLAPSNDAPESAENIPAIVSILEPADRAEVYRQVIVRGRIESLNPDLRPWLMVLASDAFYYPQCRVSRQSPSWQYEVNIGRMQWGETDGVAFDILLAAADVDGDFDLHSYMKRNGDGYGTRLPTDVKVLKSVTVIRRDIRPGGPTSDRLPPQM
jgi:hypothetical protein